MFADIVHFQSLEWVAYGYWHAVKYNTSEDETETYGGSNAVMGGNDPSSIHTPKFITTGNWTVSPGEGGNILGNPYDGGYDGGHPTTIPPKWALPE
mmetsp:Transcript_18460/g.42757  ORF Transcript_18460/g.42757 Transcript_18460/m.42757 type:complete len:96 (+) Transcript_18460:217-504(+)